jgi:hypothetical protein
MHHASQGEPPTEQQQMRPPIVITGMHRSGTSFVASLMRQAGVDIGSRLLPASRGNDLGHFENADFVDFHRRQLGLLGLDDAGWVAPDDATLQEPARADAARILAENARRGSWAWKDPRTSLFLDFWKDIAPQAYFLFVYREPAGVVDSLFRRGDRIIKFLPEMAIRAWICHNRRILTFLRSNRSRCLLAAVERVAQHPRQLLEIVSKGFNAEIDLEADSPFDPRHMRLGQSSRAALLRHFAPEVGDLYEELQSEADLPSTAAPPVRSSKEAASQALLLEWLEAATANSPPQQTEVRNPQTPDEGNDIGQEPSLVENALKTLREEMDVYRGEVSSFVSQVDRSFGEIRTGESNG